MAGIDISGMTDYYTTQASNASTSSLSNRLTNGSIENADDEALMDAARQFEAYFIEQVFKEMQKSVPQPESLDSGMETLKSYYQDALTQQYAQDAASGEGLGLAKQIYEQMKRNQ